MTRYQQSMSNIYRNDEGEHFKLTGYRGRNAVMRSFLDDSLHYVSVDRLTREFVTVTLCSEDTPVSN